MDDQKRKEKEWAIATGKMDPEPASEVFCKIETCDRLSSLGVIRLCHKHYARLRTGRMDEITGELRSLFPKVIECNGCGAKITVKHGTTKYCDYCRDNKRKEYDYAKGVEKVEYKYRNKVVRVGKKRQYHDIQIPVYDDFGDVVRYRIEQIETERDYFHYGYAPVLWDGGPGIDQKYQTLNTVIKCNCGRYTTYLGKCFDCGYYQAFPSLPIDIFGDRGKNRAIEELFLMGRISCDVAMNMHESETSYQHDGRDPEHSKWWGG